MSRTAPNSRKDVRKCTVLRTGIVGGGKAPMASTAGFEPTVAESKSAVFNHLTTWKHLTHAKGPCQVRTDDLWYLTIHQRSDHLS